MVIRRLYVYFNYNIDVVDLSSQFVNIYLHVTQSPEMEKNFTNNSNVDIL